MAKQIFSLKLIILALRIQYKLHKLLTKKLIKTFNRIAKIEMKKEK